MITFDTKKKLTLNNNRMIIVSVKNNSYEK